MHCIAIILSIWLCCDTIGIQGWENCLKILLLLGRENGFETWKYLSYFLSWNIWSTVFVSLLSTCPPKRITSFLQDAAHLNCNLFYSKSSINGIKLVPKNSWYKCRLCVFSNLPTQRFSKRMQRNIIWICMSFLHCVFKCVSSKSLLERMQSHTGCVCSTFLHYEFSNVFSNCLH